MFRSRSVASRTDRQLGAGTGSSYIISSMDSVSLSREERVGARRARRRSSDAYSAHGCDRWPLTAGHAGRRRGCCIRWRSSIGCRSTIWSNACRCAPDGGGDRSPCRSSSSSKNSCARSMCSRSSTATSSRTTCSSRAPIHSPAPRMAQADMRRACELQREEPPHSSARGLSRNRRRSRRGRATDRRVGAGLHGAASQHRATRGRPRRRRRRDRRTADRHPGDVVREVISAGAGTRSAIAEPTALLSRYIAPPSGSGSTSTPGGRAPDDRRVAHSWPSVPAAASLGVLAASAGRAQATPPAADRTGQRLRQRHRRQQRARARSAHPRAQGRERRRRGRRHGAARSSPTPTSTSTRSRCSRTAAAASATKGRTTALLIVVAVDDRRIRIEVGYDLEQFITDGFAGETIRDVITPQFRSGNYGAGLLAGATTDHQSHRRAARRHAAGRAARPAAAPIHGSGFPLVDHHRHHHHR